MARLSSNVMANYAGQGWTALMGIAFVPFYVSELGLEGFGLVGFMLGVQSLSQLLDFGASVFMSRELAQRVHHPERRESVRNLVRSFEWLVWPIAGCLAAVLFFSSDWIARNWLNPGELSPDDVTRSLLLIGATIGLLWPSSFYTSVLNGLERQPVLNACVAVFASVRYAGAVLVLILTHGSLTAFFTWMVVVAAMQTATLALLAWRSLPAAMGRARFAGAELVQARGFALGIFAATAISLVLGQVDRLALSALRPLEELGYYTVALTITAGLGRMTQPMFNAIYPRVSRLVAEKDSTALASLYRIASQALVVMAMPIAVILCVYAADVLYIWTGDAQLAERVEWPLILLAVGTALNGLMTLPYALQLAHGETRLPVMANLIGLALGLPFCVAAVQAAGMTGAAMLWPLVNLAFFLVLAPMVHRRKFGGGGWHWYTRDILPATLAALAVALAAKLCMHAPTRDAIGVASLALVWLGSMAAAACFAADVRRHLWGRLSAATVKRS